MPLIISASGSSNPTITSITKGTQYRITAGGDSAYVIMNGYSGTFTIANTGYAPKTPTIIYKNGTQETAEYTTYNANDIAALKVYQIVNHIVDYYITFN